MKTIAVVSEKGGVGKTSLSILSAITACQVTDGPVVLIDADYRPRASAWARHRSRDDRIMVIRAETANTIDRIVSQARRDAVGVCIIDTPATRTPISDRSIAVADLVVVPAKAGVMECWEPSETFEIALRARKRFVCVLMDVPARREGRDGPDVRAARQALAPLGARVWSGQITHRAAIRRVYGCSFEGENEGADDMRAIAAELIALWGFINASIERPL